MADFVQLIVQVDKSQLTSLQAEVAKLNGSNINIKTDKSGIDAAADSVKNLSGLTKLLGGSLTTIVAKMTAWQVVGAGVATVIRSFKDAVNTLKEVDTQLVTVRKVTGFDDAEIAKIKQRAFEVASAYGETADAYLESVAAFARAGYKEQSESLAELSTKTQIVGDTTAETANQFLLSVDAAYKYQGSIESLSRVLDGANELDNKYATSIEKIAEGMGIVAPVAAQMHVGVDELAASIGTITAVTQRSGSEAARALRALFLNIAGDTKTEIDEGVTWTTGEIEGLRDVIKLYAKDAYEAAEATGSVIDPMEAIGGLAQSMKDGLLTEQQLMEMVSDIGGKLRTSQLLAIIQNWDMYQSMLADFGDSVGSADKEVENALDSWERKTNILKNTWTQFLNNIIDTDAIKSALDGLTSIIETLDNGAVQTGIKIGAVLLAGRTFIKGAEKFVNWLMPILTKIGEILTTIGGVFGGGMLTGIAVVATAIAGVVAVVDDVQETNEAGFLGEGHSVQEYADNVAACRARVAELREEYDRLSDAGADLTGVQRELDIATIALAHAEEEQAKAAIEAKDAVRAQMKAAEREMTMDEWNAMLDAQWEFQQAQGELAEAHHEYVSAMVEDLMSLEDELAGATAAIEAFNEATGTEKGDTFKGYADIYAKFLEDWEAGLHGSNTVKAAIETIFGADVIAQYAGDWEALGELLASDFWRGVFAEGGDDYASTFMNALADLANESGYVVDSNGDIVASFEEVGDSIALTGVDIEALAEMLGTTPDFITAVLDAMDIWDSTLFMTKDEVLGLADSLGALGDAANSIDLTAFLEGLVENPDLSATDIWDIYNALSSIDGITLTNVPEDVGAIISKANDAKTATSEAKDELEELDDTSAKPEVSLDTSAFDRGISNVKSTLAELSKTPTIVTIVEKTQKGLAGGTDNAVGGDTLVNEEGPEIIQEGDTARIAGGGLPTITYIEPGARVFTAEETKKILDGRASFGIIRAAKLGQYTDAGTGNNSYAKTVGNTNSNSFPRSSTSYYSSSSRSYSGSSSSASSAVAAASTLEDKQKEIEDRYKTQLDLLKSQLELLEKQGASAAERAAKIAEIEDLLTAERAELAAIGASETDLNNLQVDWYEWREDKEEAIQDEIEDEIALRKSELDLLEKQGAPVDEQIAKMVQIQALLHTQAEYMRSIGASQAEINKLSSEWLDIQADITALRGNYGEAVGRIISLREGELSFLTQSGASPYDLIDKMREIQNALHEQAEYLRSTTEYQEAIAQQAEDETKLTQDQVDLLLQVQNLSTSWWQYQEKIESERSDRQDKLLAVEEAQLALANAENERTVRQYNAATGQWEWVANAQNVSQARQALSDAQNALGGIYPFEVRKTAYANAMTLPASFLSSALSGNGGIFDAMLQRMGIVTAASGGYAGFGKSIASNSYGSMHNGDVFEMNGMTIGETQAKAMTVYDFAQMARTLALHKSAI